MKKFLTSASFLAVTLVTITLTSCKETQPKIETQLPKDNKVIEFSLNNDNKPINWNGIVIASDKHQYLIIANKMDRQSVEHYIDCEFCVDRNIIFAK